MRPLHDGSVAVGLFNRSANGVVSSFARSTLPAELAGKPVIVRDLWKHEDTAFHGDVLQAAVPSHGVVLLTVRAK